MAKQTITAFYDSREYANNAALMLKQAGVPDRDITVSPESAASYADVADHPAKGFWASLEEMFGGTDDQDTYAEGLRRGGILVTAHVEDAKVDDAIDILERHGSVDLNERETTWRSEGWTGGSAPAAAGNTVTDDMSAMGLASSGTAGQASAAPASRPVAAPVGTAAPTAVMAGQDGRIDVVEERLNVGKRSINRGKVRLHAYVVETPVSETVTLRDETVRIDRRPVDRALGVEERGAATFADRTIEMEEIAEEAVVAKSARVVEEVALRKDRADTVQTVSDTVRSTKVEIEDGRTAGAAVTGFTSGMALEGLEVVGSDGQHVGVVDHVDGPTIKLKKADPAAGGQHHRIPTAWVGTADRKVTLNLAAAEAKSRWTAS